MLNPVKIHDDETLLAAQELTAAACRAGAAGRSANGELARSRAGALRAPQ